VINKVELEYRVSVTLGAMPEVAPFAATVRFYLFRYPDNGPYSYRCQSCALSTGIALWESGLWADLNDKKALSRAIDEMHGHCLRHEIQGNWALKEYANSPRINPLAAPTSQRDGEK
jgi:hypothetical protein